MDYQHLKCITPIDGRYKSKTNDLAEYFSELSFNKYRILIEIEYLISLGKLEVYDDLDDIMTDFLRDIYKNFNLDECIKLKKIEEKINHDVKAVEYYIRDIISKRDSSLDMLNYIHFGLTSQDINSSANMLMIKQSITKVLLPKMNDILTNLKKKILEWSKIPMLAKTHGQPASPTFLGKEILVFYERLVKQARKLNAINYTTKFGGANGNFNAHHMALPNIDWIEFANKFTQIFGLERNQYTTQIDHYDNYAEIFDCLRRINVILIDFCQDIWLYISRNILIQKIKEGEVGSSTMPFKVNPINFENAEGNFLLANSLLEFFSRKLPISRLQRDLTDSTILRNVGSAFSYILIAFTSLETGFNKLDINKKQIEKELNDNYVVVSEGIQTRMKVLGMDDSYEKMKEITRKHMDNSSMKKEIINFIDVNDFSDEEKKYLKTITPFNYTGIYKL
jgi:adenylosuccinate lyase